MLGKEGTVEQYFPNCTSPKNPGQGLAQAWVDRNQQRKWFGLGGVFSTARDESRGSCFTRCPGQGVVERAGGCGEVWGSPAPPE